MARHGNRQRIGSAGSGDGAGGGGLANGGGDLGIARGFSRRNRPQGLPDALLKGGALNIERQGKAKGGGFDEGDDGGDRGAEIIRRRGNLGLGEARMKIGDQLLRRIAQREAAHPRLGRRNEHLAEPAGGNGIADREARAAVAVARRAHAQHAVGSLIEAPGGAEPRRIDGLGHAGFALKRGLHPRSALALGVVLGGDAGDFFEQPVEMERAEVRLCGQLFQIRQGFRRLQQAAGPGDRGDVMGTAGDGIGAAALAGTEAVGLRFGGTGIEAHILPLRPARGAARAAIDAGRHHPIPKDPILAGIARQDLRIARIVG
ncbi:hypothetical protein VZ95_03335 [Elstera litoralis]|uniref:Uncharacterized protein n=1 Tax=Elstera litoralis TaxID=552518 RepID=A0A0F3IYL3_9PROT|nr:hypothetical protein VZ95_03335 [Elstera litoralis]